MHATLSFLTFICLSLGPFDRQNRGIMHRIYKIFFIFISIQSLFYTLYQYTVSCTILIPRISTGYPAISTGYPADELLIFLQLMTYPTPLDAWIQWASSQCRICLCNGFFRCREAIYRLLSPPARSTVSLLTANCSSKCSYCIYSFPDWLIQGVH